MSKSTGNVIAPEEVIEKYGADVLRLWVASEDYRDDIRISDEILKRLSEAYRRIRNTFRYILGNLNDFNPAKDEVEYAELEELDRLTLHRLAKLTGKVLKAYDTFEFHTIYHTVHNFCTVDLSAFYLDIIKDRLYTHAAGSKSRRAAQTTIYHIIDNLVRLMAPILVFTSDEAWAFIPAKESESRTESVHLAPMPEVNAKWCDDKLEERWEGLLVIKDEISKALEEARKGKVIGHSLDAKVELWTPEEDFSADDDTLRDILIVSQLTTGQLAVESEAPEAIDIKVTKADGEKCARCWRYDTTVGAESSHPAICRRCVEALV
jgi:isoleucyl-tRNA synthetase